MTVAKLAQEAGLDVEAALITLWEVGLESYSEPTDFIKSRDLKVASRALGVATRRDVRSPEYWRSLLGVNELALDLLLREAGVKMSPSASRLPKGAVAKLRRALASRAARQGLPSIDDIDEEEGKQEDGEEQAQEQETLDEWATIGREREVRLLTRAEVESFHWQLARDFSTDVDPIDPPGVADDTILESAVFRQHTSFGGQAKYPTAEMAAAALLHSLVHDHPFYNGNKRSALVAMIVSLDENGIMLTCPEDELFRLVLRLAQHQIVPKGPLMPDREVLYVAEWIFQNSRNVEKGDRPVQWRRLRQILRDFGCRISPATGKGNRLNIFRTITEKRRLGPSRKRVVSTQVKYADDGRQATVETVKKIRKDLELDEAHACDSLLFYRQSGPFPGEFIVKYRKTLKRLARL